MTSRAPACQAKASLLRVPAVELISEPVQLLSRILLAFVTRTVALSALGVVLPDTAHADCCADASEDLIEIGAHDFASLIVPTNRP